MEITWLLPIPAQQLNWFLVSNYHYFDTLKLEGFSYD